MADTKISALTQLAAADVDITADFLPIVDTGAGATKKVLPNAVLGLGTARQIPRINAGATAFSWGDQITLVGEQDTSSGTSWDWTIPASAKRITITLKGFSTNGTSVPIIQLGDAGGIENSGYLGGGSGYSGAGIGIANFTAGFGLRDVWASSYVVHGSYVLDLEDASDFTWICRGQLHHSDSALGGLTTGSKSLSATLTTVRLTMVNGTDAGDAGVANCSYE